MLPIHFSLPTILDSAWSLHQTLQQLDPESGKGLSDGLHKMRAVKEQMHRLQQLAEVEFDINIYVQNTNFVDRLYGDDVLRHTPV